MPRISRRDAISLANIIIEKIREEFQAKHLSGNLADTVYVDLSGDFPSVVIPAKTYNMLKYQRDGVVVYNYKGSYASKLNETGSEFFAYPYGTRKGSKLVKPHNHIGFVDRAVNSAIEQWLASMGGKYTMKSKTEM